MHYCTLSLSDIWVALLKEIFDNKIYDKYQVYSQVSFAEAGFSFGEEIFLDVVSAHIETGVGMIRADHLRIRKRNYIISSKYLSAPVSFLENKSDLNMWIESTSEVFFTSMEGQHVRPVLSVHHPVPPQWKKIQLKIVEMIKKDLQLKIFSQHTTALVCS